MAAIMYRAGPTEQAAIARVLGPGWEVRDGRAVEHPAVVFLRPCSTATIGALRRRFPAARLVVVDEPLGGSRYVTGPVRRALAAGADEYLGVTPAGNVVAPPRPAGVASRPASVPAPNHGRPRRRSTAHRSSRA